MEYQLLDKIASHLQKGAIPTISGHSSTVENLFRGSYPRMAKPFFEYFMIRANCKYSKVRVRSIDPGMLPNRIRGASEYFLVLNMQTGARTLIVISPVSNAVSALPEYWLAHLDHVTRMPLA